MHWYNCSKVLTWYSETLHDFLLCFKKTNIVYQFLFVFILSHLYSSLKRQYFRFGDVNVSLKVCKVFATFQFLSAMRTPRIKCSLVYSAGLHLYILTLSWADSLKELLYKVKHVCVPNRWIVGQSLYRNIKSRPQRSD